MTGRALPTLPTWLAGQRVPASQLQLLTTNALFWSSRPMFRMYQTVSQSVPNNTYTQLAMDTSAWDSDTGRAVLTPWAYTIPVGMTGRWKFTIKVAWVPNAVGSRLLDVARNGTIDTTAEVAATTTAASFNPGSVTTVTLLANAGDVMSAWALQDSGGALGTKANVTGASMFEGSLESLASP